MISHRALKLIKDFEGLRLTAYKCPAGVWTIGYGHTGTVDGRAIRAGLTISAEKADALLKADVVQYEHYVDSPAYVPFTAELNDNQRGALVSFAYNLGPGCLRQLCHNRTISDIPGHITAYKYANGVVLPGLVRRRQAELDLFLTPAGHGERLGECVMDNLTDHRTAPVYMTLEQVPDWARADIKELIDLGVLAGYDKNALNLSHSDVRALVWMLRLQKAGGCCKCHK